MFVNGTFHQLAAAHPGPSAEGGELGFLWLPALLGAGTFILGGGGLWILHEKHQENQKYYQCIENATEAGLPPDEAKMLCSPKLEPKEPFFDIDLGLNAKTVILGAGAVIGLIIVTRLLFASVTK